MKPHLFYVSIVENLIPHVIRVSGHLSSRTSCPFAIIQEEGQHGKPLPHMHTELRLCLSLELHLGLGRPQKTTIPRVPMTLQLQRHTKEKPVLPQHGSNHSFLLALGSAHGSFNWSVCLGLGLCLGLGRFPKTTKS